MDPFSLLPSIIPIITGRITNATFSNAVEQSALRLLRIELQTNAAILDHILPNVTKGKANSAGASHLSPAVAMAVVGQLSTSIARSMLGRIGSPTLISATFDKKVTSLVRAESLPTSIGQRRNTSPVTFTDLLDYLVRKDTEMKALAAINSVAVPGIRSPQWNIRLTNFHRVALEAARVIKIN